MEEALNASRYLFVSVFLAGALVSLPARSQEIRLGDLVISQPWSRSAPRGAELANSYVTIENRSATGDRLIAASTDVAEKIEIQQTSMAGGATTAQAVEGGLAIPPGAKVILAPGAGKLALMKLKSALKKGTQVSVLLEFEKAGKLTVPFDVLSATAKGPMPPKASPASAARDGRK
jgi:periplasmic copper chaperone A